jgi:hypothetical protein
MGASGRRCHCAVHKLAVSCDLEDEVQILSSRLDCVSILIHTSTSMLELPACPSNIMPVRTGRGSAPRKHKLEPEAVALARLGAVVCGFGLVWRGLTKHTIG